MNQEIKLVLSNYGLTEATVERLTTGLIHQTFKVGVADGHFILQKMHPLFGRETIVNVDNISQYLNGQGFRAQQVIKTKNGEMGVPDGVHWWRLLTFIPGRVVEKIDQPDLVCEAGKILGQFHYLMRTYSGFLHRGTKIHDVSEHFKCLLKVMPKDISPEIVQLKKMIADLPTLVLPMHLSPGITHGDPKISNIIFTNNNRAAALIDLDGCNDQNSILIELGDAFRSWCGDLEDDANNVFDLKKFQEGWVGYLTGCQGTLSLEKRWLVPQAVKLITLELAARFLRDYFEDYYFGWDEQRYSSRREHNLARTRGQVSLYRDLVKKEQVLSDLVRSV